MSKFDNIFILCTGRSGSTSFIKACSHITNYTSAHESLAAKLGSDRFDYPKNHIEADNRLSWFLGALGNSFNDDKTLYIHLVRDRSATVKSFNNRWNTANSIIKAFSEGIKKLPLAKLSSDERIKICEDYYDAVNTNIAYFVQDKPNILHIDFEDLSGGFKRFWNCIDAQGNQEAALAEFNTAHNKSRRKQKTGLRYRIKLFFMKLRNG